MNANWIVLVVLGAAVQWLVFASLSAFSRTRFPKKGMRRTERMLLGSTIVLAAASLALIDFGSLWKGDTRAAAASAAASSQKGSCASLAAGMTKAEVVSRVGEPDETRSGEETRGPGASVLLYKGSRCAVHLLDDKVELVE